MRLPAFEQAGEQAAEVAVDRLERGAQPFAAFAVEAADRAAQAVDRFGQLGLFCRAGALPRFGRGEFFGGDQVDRADPFPVGHQPVMRGGFFRSRGNFGGGEAEAFGQQRGRALEAFARNPGHFRVLFSRLFQGGQAHLALVDSDDPLEAGLEIYAQPPGKRLQSLTLLSGGEQALTAVALIFALFLTNPAPICVLDEVDAPLDDANIERFCDLLDAMVKETDTRYLIVTHNAVTMSRMHRLFGVTMVERGVSRLVSVDLSAAERLLAAE